MLYIFCMWKIAPYFLHRFQVFALGTNKHNKVNSKEKKSDFFFCSPKQSDTILRIAKQHQRHRLYFIISKIVTKFCVILAVFKSLCVQRKSLTKKVFLISKSNVVFHCISYWRHKNKLHNILFFSLMNIWNSVFFC